MFTDAATRYGAAQVESTLVAVVDDEAAVRVAPGRLLRLAGLRAERMELPVVFITGSDDPGIERLALAGGLRVLHKPFGNDALLAAIDHALQAPHP